MTDASLAPAVLENLGTRPPVPWPVIEACGLPEIGPHLADVSVHLEPALTTPFVVESDTVLIRPDRAATVTGAALILREAVELHARGDATVTWADRILAHATAVLFGATTMAVRDESTALAEFSPLSAEAESMLALHDTPGDTATAIGVATRIADHLADRDGDGATARCPSDQIERAARALPFAAPTEVLIASGGDDRQLVDWRRGVNRYNIAPSPTPWITSFGSCTASSPTIRGFAAAGDLRRRLIDAALAGTVDETVTSQYEQMRRTLLAALGVRDATGVDVVFTPSGTDAELVPLLVSLAAGAPVHNVVVGPHEIGSGSVEAAIGRHFGTVLPSGRTGRSSQSLDGFDADRVALTTVDVRDAAGRMRPAQDLEDAVQAAIERHHDTHRTLLHLVEGSKTGIRLPRRDTVRAWQDRYADRLDVVVDAAQMRVDQRTAVSHLRSDCMVIVTGSKFFGGPPFSGAVLVPSGLVARAASTPVPAGVADYLTRPDVPAAWPSLRAASRAEVNAGFMLRWEAALSEMRSFHNVSPEIRDEVLRVLAARLRDALERATSVRLVESPYTSIPQEDDRGLDELPTIFTFLAIGADGRPLTMDECDAVHRLLAVDVRASVASNDPVLGRRFQLGRPVKVQRRGEEWVGGLRIAVGAPTVSDVVFDHSRGRTWTDRIEHVVSDVTAALRKIDLVIGASLYSTVD